MFTSTPNGDGKKIRSIIDAVACMRHKVPAGIPCFHVTPGVVQIDGYLAGVCGRRIRKAGFNGVISPDSMRTKAQRAQGPRKFQKK